MLRQSDDFPLLKTQRLVVRMLEPSDAGMMASFRLANRHHLESWEPTRRPEFYTESFWFMQIQALLRDFRHGQSVCFSILPNDESEILGVCNFTSIVRGTFQSCHLGYALAEQAQGKGIMFEALKVACDFMFEEQHLHRIMANYMPRNSRSGLLLTRLGFEVEGHAKQFLMINGRWEDHVLTSLINPRDQ